ncbi:MAG: xanthine dehydrogenase molybdopterin binding subunit [Enterovirga sp.]|nr:xanthine dehydrogenase molybdopterin binding subunit [Enterovirga sp.]
MLERSPVLAVPGEVGTARRHDSAPKHVSGEATYIDDIVAPAGLLHACLGLADRAHANIVALDLDRVRAAPGVVLVLTADDIPGANDVTPVTGHHDEPVFATDKVTFHGQPLFAVVARTRDAARRAARLAEAIYVDLPPVLDVAAARTAGAGYVTAGMTLTRGDAPAALAAAPRRIKGRVTIGGQDHFYLEGQVALAIPGEDGDVLVHASTQHPTEVQHMVARVLGVPFGAVTVEVRRMGGGFGGKETQGNLFAAVAALAATKLCRPVKIRPDRDDDMIATGKRHDFVIDYEIGHDDEGRILAVEATYAARCGHSADLSGPVTDRALFHADNCYFIPDVHLSSEPWRTNTVSNTAFRGFGAPQGMVGAERFIDEIAYATGRDPLDIRLLNLYGQGGAGDVRSITPYHQTVEDNIAPELIAELERRSQYRARRAAIRAWNAQSRVLKRGIALTPVKFGMSFTATQYNQAGALVHVYTDGSVQLNHAGTEMGQGLHVKVAQVVAGALGIGIDAVAITATSTGKVPNTSATAASSGSDLNGMAALDACETIKARLAAFAAGHWGVDPAAVAFLPGRVRVGTEEVAFADLVCAAYGARVQLSATGFYRTPKIHWDRTSGRGHPFYYFAYGAACAEVVVDTLTGEYRVERADILHDVGRSLNPAVDRGQIEGGFIQGMGWLTTEELWWDGQGRLRTHAPATYKIPVASDRPRVFNVDLFEGENRENTIGRSKGVGEPPLMLGISVLHALSDAVASVADHSLCPRLDTPATPERVLFAVQALRERAGP